MNTYAIYRRKSTEGEDRQVLSLDSQRAELEEFAKRAGHVVVRDFCESMSARKPGRPVFAEMLKDVQRGKFNGVIAWKLDRLSRNMTDGGKLIDLMDAGALAEIVTPGRTFHSTSDDHFMMAIEFGTSRKYVDDLSSNVKRGRRAKATAGWYPGKPPIGYLNVKDPRTGAVTIAPDPDRFALVRRMWDLMLTGEYAPARIVEMANEQWGLRTVQCRQRGGVKLHVSTAYALFHHPFYYGAFRYVGELHDGKHEPMITRSEWERVQALLGAPDNPRPQRHAFPYIGLLHCGTCGCAITADAHVKPSGKRFVYYHCTRKNRDVPCKEPPIPERVLSDHLRAFCADLGEHADFARWAFSRLARMADTDRTAHERSVASLESEVAARVRKRDALIDMRMRDILTDEEFLQRKNALAAEEGRLTQQLAEIQTRPSTWVELCENAFSLVNEAKLRFDEGTDEEKRLLLNSVGLNWRLTAGKPLCELQKPFSLFPKSDEIPVWSG